VNQRTESAFSTASARRQLPDDPPKVGLLLTPEHEAAVRSLLDGQDLVLQRLTTSEARDWSLPNGCLLISHRAPALDCLSILEALKSPESSLPSACVVVADSVVAGTAIAAMKAGALDFIFSAGLTTEAVLSTLGAAIESFENKAGLDRQSQEHAHLAAIVASSTDAIVSLEADGATIRTWSRGAEALFGYAAEEAVGQTVDALIIPASKTPERTHIYESVCDGHQSLIVETERSHKDGTLIPVEINVSPMVLSDGNVVGYSVVFRDLSERRKAEEAVREALDKLSRREAELTRAQRIAGIGSYEVECHNGRFVGRRSPEYLRIHGVGDEHGMEAHEEWVGRIHPEDRPRAEQSFKDALAGDGSEYETEYRIIRPADGAVRWIRVLAEIDRSEGSRPTRLFGTHIDITEQKLAADTLRASEDRLRLAIEAAKLGLFEIDWEKRQRHWSPELKALLAVPDELDVSSDMDLIGKIVTPEQLERYRSKLQASFDPSRAEYEDEHEVLCFDGQRRHVLLRARTLFAESVQGPKPVRTVGFMMDITKHKKAEQQRDLLLHELDHRIKNIFSTISSIISLSAHTAESVDEYAASLRERLFALTAVHDLVRNVDLKGTTTFAAVANAVTRRGLADKIKAEGPDLKISVQAATAFGMILNEFLTNALKYGALSNPDGAVKLKWAAEGDEFSMSWVENGGPPVVPRRRVGFGSRMIERVVAGLGGRSDLSLPSSGLRAEITCPLANLT